MKNKKSHKIKQEHIPMVDEEETVKIDADDIIKIDTDDLIEKPVDDVIDLLLQDEKAEIRDYDKIATQIETEGDGVKKKNPLKKPLSPDLVSNSATKAVALSIGNNSALQAALGDPTENDALVIAVRKESSTSTLLNVLMEEMAEEAAYIKAWRNLNWGGKEDLSEATARRIKMLKDMVDTLVEKEKLKKEKSVGKIDFYGENFQRVLKYFLEVIQRTFQKVAIPSQFEDIFFTQLAKEFDGFEKAAEKTYYGKS